MVRELDGAGQFFTRCEAFGDGVAGNGAGHVPAIMSTHPIGDQPQPGFRAGKIGVFIFLPDGPVSVVAP